MNIREELEAKTLLYWRISQLANGYTQEDRMSVGTAIEVCASLIATTDPNRPVCKLAQLLMNDVIYEEPRVYSQSSTILQLK